MAVIELVKYSNRETIAALRVLLSKAQAGELRGVAVCFRTLDGEEDTLFTGAYKAHPGDAAHTAMRLSLTLAHAQGGFAGPP